MGKAAMNVNRVTLTKEMFEVSKDSYELLESITAMQDNVIVRLIEHEAKSAGGIVLSDKSVEKSTLAVVLKPNKISYHRDGKPTNAHLEMGNLVRLQRGNVGTTMPEAPDGEKWLCVPESCIYYSQKIKVDQL